MTVVQIILGYNNARNAIGLTYKEWYKMCQEGGEPQ